MVTECQLGRGAQLSSACVGLAGWRNGAGAGGGAGCVDGDEPTRCAVRGRLERHRSVSYNWHRVPPMIGWYGMT